MNKIQKLKTIDTEIKLKVLFYRSCQRNIQYKKFKLFEDCKNFKKKLTYNNLVSLFKEVLHKLIKISEQKLTHEYKKMYGGQDGLTYD